MQSWMIIGLIATGLTIGLLSGMLGIGGGVLVIPVLVLIFHFDQKVAIGTSLAMLLPPIGIFAVLQYYRIGLVNVPGAGLLAIGFALGAWGGSRLVQYVPESFLRYLLCAFLIYVTGNMLFRGDQKVWAAMTAVGLAVVYAILYFAFRLLGWRWENRRTARELYIAKASEPVAIDYEI